MFLRARDKFSYFRKINVRNIRLAVARDKFAFSRTGYDDRVPNLSTDRLLGSIRFRLLIGDVILSKVRLGDFPVLSNLLSAATGTISLTPLIPPLGSLPGSFGGLPDLRQVFDNFDVFEFL